MSAGFETEQYLGNLKHLPATPMIGLFTTETLRPTSSKF